MADNTFKEEMARVVIRIRELIALGKTNQEISEETGRTVGHVGNIRKGKRLAEPKVPVTYFRFRKIQPGERCKTEGCKNHPQLLTKDDLCPECALLWLHKLGFLKVGEKDEQQKNQDTPSS